MVTVAALSPQELVLTESGVNNQCIYEEQSQEFLTYSSQENLPYK